MRAAGHNPGAARGAHADGRATDGATGPPITGDATERAAEHIAVLRCQLGDEDAFEALYDRYSDQVFYYLCRLLGAHDRAEDVLQEVWLTVYRRLATLDNPGAFKAWLFRVAHNRAIGVLRKSGRWIALDEPLDDAGEGAALVEGVMDEGLGDVDAARVHAALDHLAPAHREVLTLRFMGELSYAEIAEVTGCPLGTVKSRIHHAKAALRQTFGELEVEGASAESTKPAGSGVATATSPASEAAPGAKPPSNAAMTAQPASDAANRPTREATATKGPARNVPLWGGNHT